MPYESSVDVLHDRRHALTGDPYARESVVYMVQLPELGLMFGAYTWVDGSGTAGCAASILQQGAAPRHDGVDGVAVDDAADFDDWRLGPLVLRHREAHRTASLRWTSERFSFELEFEATHEPFAYADAPGGCPTFVADDRIEQSGRVRGTLRFDGQEHAFDGQGHRDHSWGVRDWEMIQHYKWFEGQAGESRVHVFEITARGERSVHGFVHREGVLSAVRDAHFALTTDEAMFVTEVTLVVHDHDGRATTVRGTELARTELHVSPAATLVDSAMEIEVDGVTGGGYLDLSWPPPYLAHMRETTYATGARTR